MKHSLILLGLFIVSIVLPGVTLAADSQVMCTMAYAPVCAAHQVECIKAPCYPVYQTYGNACTAGAADSKIIHQGECTPAESGPIVGTKPAATPTTSAPVVKNGAYVPPASCVAWFDGCNSCAVSTNGQILCTMRACFAPAAGYCTAHATSTKIHISTDAGVTSTTSGALIAITANFASSSTTSLGWNAGWLSDFIGQCIRAFSRLFAPGDN